VPWASEHRNSNKQTEKHPKFLILFSSQGPRRWIESHGAGSRFTALDRGPRRWIEAHVAGSRPSDRKTSQNFKRPKNCEDSSDIEDFLTDSIATALAIIFKIFESPFCEQTHKFYEKLAEDVESTTCWKYLSSPSCHGICEVQNDILLHLALSDVCL